MRQFLFSVLALGAMSSLALAQPAQMSDDQMDKVAAGNPVAISITNSSPTTATLTSTVSQSATSSSTATCTTCTGTASATASGTNSLAAASGLSVSSSSRASNYARVNQSVTGASFRISVH